ncbi:hypothetical protein NNC19_20145 [Clostridium sp. SHJSY1]|uniref:hypothetical protein n=1 Tax=Clostridium sp. SHJSY1 TaxID=2942483 RepID=UPI00287705BB|nr:hypothetical protein [Clostridium sp. SHJSY1]MDS0528009.1 hypothetical protein [Clostridium sp. SHJSY1]
MRYTRYDYKKKKGENFFGWLLLIIIISLALGMGVYKLLIGSSQIGKKENTTQEVVNSVNEEKAFGIIQCGLFSNKNNAESTLKTIPDGYEKFIVEESGSFKLMAGIYPLTDSESKSQELTKGSISNFRMACKLDSAENKTEAEIIDAYIKVINKLYEKDVKSIDTKEFKTWVKDVLSKDTSNNEEIKQLANNVESLPDEYKKENSNESLVFLYNILIKYKQS